MKKNVFKTLLMAAIFAGAFILSSCQFSPTSTTVTIKNESDVEIAYWLEYRLGSMQDLDKPAPTLKPGESFTWPISGKLSATAEKENGLLVEVIEESELDLFKKANKNRKDSDILLYVSSYDVPKISNSFDAAETYKVVIKGVSSKEDIKLQ